ncbi:MAG TPA: helix-turn-helix transcriptional regulator [Herpetosiphonaceae bacterium]|nr:helix-turn-helix transcriptional regulator [Herpetosiphonaceae bacterium]
MFDRADSLVLHDDEQDIPASLDDLLQELFPDELLDAVVGEDDDFDEYVKALAEMSWTALLTASSLLYRRAGLPVPHGESARSYYLQHLRRRLARIVRGSRALMKGAKGPRQLSALSKREIEVLRLAEEGLSDDEVARVLCITRYTVSKHLGNAYSKLQVRSRLAAVKKARDAGIIL